MTSTETNWAVVELGGKQHLVLAGSKIQVNRLETKAGETITVKSLLDQTPVTLKVTEELRGEKIHGLKFKNKVRYIRHYGHRQNLSALEVISIGGKVAEKPVEKAEAKAPAAKKAAPKKAAK
ncbi:MAG TPA: bL21 family ribosomal protein [Candidatus Saccharimonadales bacterium]|nr:bL21 family ribosomal protein [Candidatus Saccharimonadales bacterium]